MATALLVSPNKSTNVRSATDPVYRAAWPLRALARLSPALAARAAARAFFTTWRPRVRAEEAALLDQADRFTVPFGGVRLPIWSFGEGPTILLGHGWNGRGAQLAPLAAALASAGFRAVTFDQPAHGEAPGRRTTALEMSRALSAVAGALGGVQGVVAHSLGTVSTTYALSRGLAPRRLVYLAPAIAPDLWVTSFAERVGLAPHVVAPLRRAIEGYAGLPLAALDPLALAPRLGTPLLVVHDRDDREVPLAAAHALTRAWPGAGLMTTSGLGHHRLLRDPEVGERIIRFLAPLSRAARDARTG